MNTSFDGVGFWITKTDDHVQIVDVFNDGAKGNFQATLDYPQ